MYRGEYQFCGDRFGDENCDHQYDKYDLEKQDGILFCIWTCSKCGREVTHATGAETYPPTKGEDSAYNSMDGKSVRVGDLIKPHLFSVKEYADMKKVSSRTIRSEIKKGRIKAERVGKEYRISGREHSGERE